MCLCGVVCVPVSAWCGMCECVCVVWYVCLCLPGVVCVSLTCVFVVCVSVCLCGVVCVSVSVWCGMCGSPW